MQRRGFLSAILGAAAAPAIVSASSLMKVVEVKPYVPVAYRPYAYEPEWFKEYVQDADGVMALRPTKLLLPSTMMAQALAILNAEFDKQYAMTTAWREQ